MTSDFKRISFAVTPQLEKSLDHMKQEFFYNETHSHMIRELLSAGIRAVSGETVCNKEQA